jgi:ABC-type sugar transport system permease subunit
VEEPISRWQMMRAQLGEKGMLILFLIPALIVLLLVQGYPLAYSGYFSLVDWTLAKSPTPGGFVGLANYSKAFSDSVFVGAIQTTVTFALAATFFEMLIGFFLAYLTVGERRLLQISRTILIMPMVVAPVAVGTLWRMMFSARAGLINYGLSLVGITGPDWLGNPAVALTALIIIDVWEWSPFVMIIYVAALSSLPAEPFRAAAVDGASRWQIFRYITLPLLLPVTILVLMFRLIDTLLTLDIVYTTTYGGPGFKTHTLSFWIYQQGLRYFNISYAAATSWILLIACLLIATGFLIWRGKVSARQS